MSDHLSDSVSNPVSGSFILLIGNSVALLFSAVGSVLVALMLSPSEYGLFSITLVLPNMFVLFSDWGVNQALIRYIAQYRANDKIEDIKDLAISGYIFKFVIGGMLSLLLFLFADFLAEFLIRRPEVGGFIRLTSVLVLSQSLYTTAIAILAGFEKMNYRASINIIQSFVKGGLSPLLVYLGFGVPGVVIGHTLSFSLAALIGLFSVYSLIEFSLSLQRRVKENIKLLLLFGLPLFYGNILLGFSLNIRGLLLSWFVSAETIGNYSIASWFFTYVSVLTTSVGVNLFPAFSKYNLNDEPKKLKEIFQVSVRYSSMFLLPLVCMLIVISKPLIYTLFAGKYPQAPLLLSLRLVPILFVGLGSLSINRIFMSQGDTQLSSKITIISSLISITLSIVFIYLWNIIGFIVSFMLSSFINALLGLIILHKEYRLTPNLNHTMKTMICSFTSMVVTWGFLYFYSTIPIVDFFISIIIFVLVYLILAPFIRAIEKVDIMNIDVMLKNIKIIYPLARYILDFEERIVNFAHGSE